MFQELAPDFRQVADDMVGPGVWPTADDILQGETDTQSSGIEAARMWSDVKQAMSKLGSGEGQTSTTGGNTVSSQEETIGLGWEGLRRDMERAAAGAFGDVRKFHRVLRDMRTIC